MKPIVPIALAFEVVFLLSVALAVWWWTSTAEDPAALVNGTGRVAVVFSGGHETDPVDGGRPVVLIAAALGVPTETFREAFRHLDPAPAGMAPDRGRVQANKAALLAVLGPLGISNERLDTVSDYYRYNRSRGEMWPTQPAKAYALVDQGVITGFEISDLGSGYSSPPTVTVPGYTVGPAVVELAFGPQFDRNGSIAAITLPEAPVVRSDPVRSSTPGALAVDGARLVRVRGR